MEIVVCIKQVPDTTEAKIDPVTNTLIRQGLPSIINPFDENAIEEALRLKEKHGGRVTVVTMGPPQAKEALKQAIAMGVDDAVLLSDRAFAGSDTWATSYTLSQAIKKLGPFDLIFCGKQAIDGDTAQVGPGIAEWLSIPQATFAVKVEIENNKAKVERLLEEVNEIVEIPLPCLITVVKQINEPRSPSLKGMMRAKKTEPKILTAADIEADTGKTGLKASPTRVVKISTPQRKSMGEMLEGGSSEVAEVLVKKLKERKLI